MVKFYLSPRPDKQGECPIRVSISVRGTRLISTTGFSIAPEKWDQPETYSKALGRVKKGYYNSKGVASNIINARLKAIDSHFSNYEIGLDHQPTAEELAEHLAAIKGKKWKDPRKAEVISPIEYFDQFVIEESRINQWADGTLQCWRAFRKHLKNQQFKCISDIDEKGVARFVEYLRRTRQMNEKTVQKHHSNLMWFLGWCERKGYYRGDSIHRIKAKFKVIAPPVIFLTREELLKLYNYHIPPNGTRVKLLNPNGEEYEKTIFDAAALEKTRDLFCFCAFTSLRYSDMAKLKKSDIHDGCLHIVTKKTDDNLSIELNDYSEAILAKYGDRDFPNGIALPVISNQKMNDYIKILGELCGFVTPITKIAFIGGQRKEITQPKWKMLGTHAGRRTFICFALSQGIPPQVVMKWTGHSDYKAMKPYIDVANETRQKAMRDFNKGLEE